MLVRLRVNREIDSGGTVSILREKIDDSTCAHFLKNDREELAVNTMYPTHESSNFEIRGLTNGRKQFNRCQCTVNSDFWRYLWNWCAYFFFLRTKYSQYVQWYQKSLTAGSVLSKSTKPSTLYLTINSQSHQNTVRCRHFKLI